jgi:hypothetical protein
VKDDERTDEAAEEHRSRRQQAPRRVAITRFTSTDSTRFGLPATCFSGPPACYQPAGTAKISSPPIAYSPNETRPEPVEAVYPH